MLSKWRARFCRRYIARIGEFSAVTTRGDEVKRWATREELLALLGPIDTIDDALLVVMSHGYSVDCPPARIPGYPREVSIDAKAGDGGFEVTAARNDAGCPVTVTRYRLFVSTDGQVSELDAQDFRWGVCV